MTDLAQDKFFHRSLDLNCLASLDGMFIDLNARWQEVLGYTPEELKAKPFMEFIHPEDIASTNMVLAQLSTAQSLLSFRNRYRASDGHYLWLQWSAYPPDEGEEFIYASARVIDELVEFEHQAERSNNLVEGISLLQNAYIQHGEGPQWWESVLNQLLALTRSEYGFIGVTGKDSEGKFLRTKAITNIAWNDETRKFYEDNAPQGLEFRNMNSLFGRPILEERVLISNDVAHDPRAAGRPSGHPPLNSFAGIPIREESSMYGLIGLANAPGGYTEADVEMLRPITVLLANVLRNIELETQADESKKQLESVRMLQGRVLKSSQTGFLVLDTSGQLALVNQQACLLLQLEEDAALRSDTPGLQRRLKDLFHDGQPLRSLLTFIDNKTEDQSSTLKMRSRLSPVGVASNIEVVATWIGEAEHSFPLLLSLNDIRQRQALANSLTLNSKLEVRIQQLAQTQRHNETLSECVEFLQTCTSLKEGLRLLARFTRRFYEEAAETRIFGVNEDDATTMRELTPSAKKSSVERHVERHVRDCWALRSRRVYAAWDGGHPLRCAHSEHVDGLEYCVPLFSLEQVVAVFSVRFTDGVSSHSEEIRRARLSEFAAMGQSISGALSTIALRESLQREALSDVLTGLPNRRAFQAEARNMIARCRRTDRQFSVGIIDIDHFKRINDELGHAEGDVVLKHLASQLEQHFRDGDLCARLGGEEFGVLMTDCEVESSHSRLSSLLDRVRTRCRIGERLVTISIGFIHSTGITGETDLDDMLNLADKALYLAKEGGRDRVEQGEE